MPTSDNLNDMDNWSNRRDEARRNFIANRDVAQAHAVLAQKARPLVNMRELRATLAASCAAEGIPCTPGSDQKLERRRD